MSDKYKAGKAGRYKGGDAHGRKQYKGNAGKRLLRMVNRLHGSPVAYMDRIGNDLTSAGAEKERCGSAHTGIRAGTQ